MLAGADRRPGGFRGHPQRGLCSGQRRAAPQLSADVTPTAVIQVKQGIGDVIWHLPYIRALAAMVARIPQRIGVGFAKQRPFITNAGIHERYFHEMPMEWLRALMAEMGVPLPSTEPDLKLPDALVKGMLERYRATPRPWIVLALGASHPAKDWPARHWQSFVEALRRRTTGTVFLIGGLENAVHTAALIANTVGAPAIDACGLALAETAALLRHADLFVGPDSGPMNLAAAGGTPAFALFGATPVLRYSKFIHAIEPPDGRQTMDGMARILPSQVLARIEPHLAAKLISS